MKRRSFSLLLVAGLAGLTILPASCASTGPGGAAAPASAQAAGGNGPAATPLDPAAAPTAATPEPAAAPAGTAQPAPGSDVAVQGEAGQAEVVWTDEALALFNAEVPKFVQKVARKSMEKKARERGISLIDKTFYLEMKQEQGF